MTIEANLKKDVRFASYDFYAPEEDVLGHHLDDNGRRFVVTRKENRRGRRLLYIVTEEGEDGMVEGMWVGRNCISNPYETTFDWHPDKTLVSSPRDRDDLFARAQEAERVRALQSREAKRRREEDQMLFEEFLREHTPADAKAILVAELVQYKCNRGDYFISRVVSTVFLGFSKSGRNSFPEMRKLAASYSPTAHLAGPEGVEHRENYTGGDGYYLGGKPSLINGWTIRKYVLPYTPDLRVPYTPDLRVDCRPWLERQGRA